MLAVLLATLLLALVLVLAPREPRTFTILPSQGVVVFQPGEAREGDLIACPGHGSVEVQPPGVQRLMPGGVSTGTESDGAVFASCSTTNI